MQDRSLLELYGELGVTEDDSANVIADNLPLLASTPSTCSSSGGGLIDAAYLPSPMLVQGDQAVSLNGLGSDPVGSGFAKLYALGMGHIVSEPLAVPLRVSRSNLAAMPVEDQALQQA